MADRVLLVFLKEPRPGTVKTRLAQAIGDEAASALYRVLAEEVVRHTRGDWERLFLFTPAEAELALRAWLPGETLLPQEGGDLGARMAAAFKEAFARGARKVAIIGTDTPWIRHAHVQEAFDTLADVDMVIGPAADGGYWLLALAAPRPELFKAIAWGTGSVFTATVERASTLGLAVHNLEVQRDLDTLADLRALWPRLLPLLPETLASSLEPHVR